MRAQKDGPVIGPAIQAVKQQEWREVTEPNPGLS